MHYPHLNPLPLLEAALTYARNGHPVLPLQPNGKAPLTQNGIHDATTDETVIRGWWAWWPNANIGIKLNARYHVLDVDNKNGKNGTASYLAAGGQVAWECLQPVQRTPGGGLHVLFATDEKLRKINSRGISGGLDLICGGRGYALAAPSVIDGKRYEWSDGDPEASLPAELMGNLRRWCDEKPSVDAGAVPMPTPTEMTDAEVEQRIAALGEPHATFLLEGDAIDKSSAAYSACWHAFLSGWTKEDMAAIGPHTTLATFGAEPPHSAPDPWAWCWRYTVSSAWNAVQAQRTFAAELVPEKETPPRSGVGEGTDSDSKTVDHIVPPTAEPSTFSFEGLCARAAALQPNDIRAVQRLVVDAVQARLGPGEMPTLLGEIKTFGGVSLGTLREMEAEYRSALKSKRCEAGLGPKARQEVYVVGQGKVFDPRTELMVSETAFRNSQARKFGGDADRAWRECITDANPLCAVVEQLTYHPGLPSGVAKDGRKRVYNTYRPTELVAQPGDVSPWLSLLRSLRLEGGQPTEGALLDRLAYDLQNPGKKINHGVLIGGAPGLGKDSFLEPFLQAVGKHNVKHTGGAAVESQYTDWLTGAKVVILNELTYGDHRDRERLSERLKPVLAAPPDELEVNEKYLSRYYIPNLASIYAFTNSRFALFTVDGDRRWWSIWAANEIPPPGYMGGEPRQAWEDFFRGYWGWVNRGGAQAVYAWLLARDVRHYDPKAKPTVSDWQKEMSDNSSDPLAVWLREAITERYGCFALPVVDLGTVLHDIRQICEPQLGIPTDRLNPQRVSRALAEMGLPRRKKRGGPRLYFPRGVEKEIRHEDMRALDKYKRSAGVPAQPVGGWSGKG